jgi:hypothetical protein
MQKVAMITSDDYIYGLSNGNTFFSQAAKVLSTFEREFSPKQIENR